MVFARHPARITQLYGADLLGGSLACLALVPLLNFIGGPNTILFAAAVVALAGVAWAQPGKRLSPAVGGCVSAGDRAELQQQGSGHCLRQGYESANPPVYARWNAFRGSRSINSGTGKVIVIDADANTFLMNTDPHHWRDDYRRTPMSAAPSVANVLRPHGDFAIIGPGGGVDVLRAVANGSTNVTGIEINPIIANNIMRDRFADYTFHLYQIPEVHMHVSDGRSFVRNSHDQYDVVQMTLVDTWASTAAGAFALSENNLYTVDAFREYFEHLKPDGMIAITRWEFAKPREALRVVSQAMEALHEMGVEDTTQNFIVVSDGSLDNDGKPVVVLAKKTPFTMEEQQAVLDHIQGKDGNGANLNLRVLYMPATADEPGMAHPAFAQLILGQDPHKFSAVSLQCRPGDRQRTVFLLHPEAGAGLPRLGCRRHRLEGQSRHRHPGNRADGLDCGGDFSSCCRWRCRRKPARAAACASLLHRHRPGLHHGGDRLHPALRALSRISDVCADGGGLPDAALQRRRQPGFAQVVR